MQAVLDEELKAESQPEAFEAFQEVLAGERTRIVETSEERSATPTSTSGMRPTRP